MLEREWKEEYNVGCDYVDIAHRKLFKILWKVLDLLLEQDYEKNKHACKEAIKFLYNYTATHFEEEELYMKEIGYMGYEAHKKVHDEMKNETVPLHDMILQKSDYSKESVREFVGFFTGWLTGHILVMDKAITDHTLDKINASDISVSEKIIKEMDIFSKKILRYPLTVFSLMYDNKVYEESIYYELSYRNTDIVFMAEKGIVKKIVAEMIGETIEVIDKAVLISFIQLMMYAGRLIYYSVSSEIVSKPDCHRIVKSEDVKSLIEGKIIINYVEWKNIEGNMAVFVLK